MLIGSCQTYITFYHRMVLQQLQNNVHRYVADPNRSLGMINPKGDYRYEVVYSKTTFDKPIYQKTLSPDEVYQRIETFYNLITISCKN
jgi:N-formylglutamate amidohydrolase